LDEPFSNLDVSARNQMEILLNRIHEKYQMTIIIVSHDLSFIPSRCTRVIALDKGKIIMDGKKAKILTSESLKIIFNKNEVRP
jgi:ABC-type glutathione transport system ATPase component